MTTTGLPNITADVFLKPNKEESLLRFHPWVFSGAIASRQGDSVEGDLVRVLSSQKKLLGIGHCAPESIAVRILAFANEAQNVGNSDFYYGRLSSAYLLRKGLGLISQHNNTFRLVHGEGDRLPGLIIDVYGNTAVMQAHTVGMHRTRHLIAELLPEVTKGLISNVYYKSEGTLPYMANVESADGYLLGNKDDQTPAIERGFGFHADWLRGQKTGFFVDQRDNRALVEDMSKDRRVLNLFSYTGGFSIAALRGGAREVVSVDSSAKAISIAKENVELNFPQDMRHTAIAADAFNYLAETGDNAHDLIILDPPAFAKHRRVLRNALVGYRKLNTLAFQKIASGGILFTFSCSQAVSREDFRLAVFSSAAATGRRVRILHQMSQPADHPINIYHPESEYLKGLVLEVE